MAVYVQENKPGCPLWGWGKAVLCDIDSQAPGGV